MLTVKSFELSGVHQVNVQRSIKRSSSSLLINQYNESVLLLFYLTAGSFLFEAETLNVVVVGVNMSNPQSPPRGNFKFLPSVCSMVVSANQHFSVWIHSIRVQKRGSELIAGIDDMLKDCLQKRSAVLKIDWPTKIIFMRDGVSEGKIGRAHV